MEIGIAKSITFSSGLSPAAARAGGVGGIGDDLQGPPPPLGGPDGSHLSKDPVTDSQELNALIQNLMGNFGGAPGAVAAAAAPAAGIGPAGGVSAMAGSGASPTAGGASAMASAGPMGAAPPDADDPPAGAPSPAGGRAGSPGGPGGSQGKDSQGLSGLTKLAEVFGKVAGSALKGLMSAFGGGGGPKPG